MRAVSVRWLLMASLVGACTDEVHSDPEAHSPEPDVTEAGGSGAANGNPEDPGPPLGNEQTQQPGKRVTIDRCHASACDSITLPEQPALAFLEEMGDGWQRLMEADWALAAGTEGYRCMTLTVPRDVRVIAFSPQSPRGTHHATFGIYSQPQGPDQVVACGVGSGGERKLHGSGAGSEAMTLPEGVAMVLRAGEQIHMNLHLFNPTDAVLSGRSGMWIKTAMEEHVEHEAEAVLAGPLQLAVPPGRSTQTGGCTIRSDATLYGLGPHMHQLGVHMRVTVVRAHGEQSSIELYDGSYDFERQVFHRISPMPLSAGDRVMVECTYENTTGRTVSWGDSSLDEMCFASMGLFPAADYGRLPCFD
ncbi:MAG: hypothetical protein OXR73_33165 [Myxococcales bacterium]|nr:hypothetical protein [Myxococcales bacterium]